MIKQLIVLELLFCFRHDLTPRRLGRSRRPFPRASQDPGIYHELLSQESIAFVCALLTDLHSLHVSLNLFHF